MNITTISLVYVADYSHRNEEDKCILYKGDVGDSNFNSAQNTEENPNKWVIHQCGF